LAAYAAVLTLMFLVVLDYYNIPSRLLERIEPVSIPAPVARPVKGYADVRRELFDHARIDWARIVMLGDSHVDHLNWREFLGRDDVVNRGIGGDESLDVLRRLDQVLRLSPCLCVLMVGINDLQHERPPSLVAARIEQIVDRLRQHDIDVLLVSVLPVGLVFDRHAARLNAQVAVLNRALARLAERDRVDYLDLASRLAPDGFMPAGLTIRDGLHFSSEVYLTWRRELLAYLDRWASTTTCHRPR